MKSTSPLLIGICVALACVSLGLTGYIFLGSSPDEGIDPERVAPARVAVIDLEAVAQRLGRIDAMNQKLRDQGANLNEQLKKIQGNLKSQVATKANEIKSLGAQVTDEQKRKFAGMVQGANQQYDIAKRKAVIFVNKQKAVMVKKFRDEAIAVAKKVAKEQGFDMVMEKNETVVLSFDPSFDITEAVIEAMPAIAPVVDESSEEVTAASQEQTGPTAIAQAQENTYR